MYSTHSLNVLNEVHERRVSPVRLKHLPLVEEGVDKMGVVVEVVSQTRIDNLQHHLQDLLQNRSVSGLCMPQVI